MKCSIEITTVDLTHLKQKTNKILAMGEKADNTEFFPRLYAFILQL